MPKEVVIKRSNIELLLARRELIRIHLEQMQTEREHLANYISQTSLSSSVIESKSEPKHRDDNETKK
jgi:hypothetical protein